MKIEMVRVNDSGRFKLPDEYEAKCAKINRLSIDNNTLPPSTYALIGPRKADITILIPKETVVYADIDQL